MAKGIQPGEKMDAPIVYADIIDLPRWEPSTRPRMSLLSRAAQFAPFAALTGFGDMVEEEARLTDREIELTDEEKDLISWKLGRIQQMLSQGERPEVTLEYFVPDPFKEGGEYVRTRCRIRRLDPAAGTIIPDRKAGENVPEVIRINRLTDIRGDDLKEFPD